MKSPTFDLEKNTVTYIYVRSNITDTSLSDIKFKLMKFYNQKIRNINLLDLGYLTLNEKDILLNKISPREYVLRVTFSWENIIVTFFNYLPDELFAKIVSKLNTEQDFNNISIFFPSSRINNFMIFYLISKKINLNKESQSKLITILNTIKNNKELYNIIINNEYFNNPEVIYYFYNFIIKHGKDFKIIELLKDYMKMVTENIVTPITLSLPQNFIGPNYFSSRIPISLYLIFNNLLQFDEKILQNIFLYTTYLYILTKFNLNNTIKKFYNRGKDEISYNIDPRFNKLIFALDSLISL